MGKGGHNEASFKSAIFELSTSSDWDTAKAEWELHFVYEDFDNRSCICGHSPIQQICVIKNWKNGNKTEVGNVCVRRFLRLLSNRIFSVIKRVRGDIKKSFNPKALELFRDRGVISRDEEESYLRYWRQRIYMHPDDRLQKHEINSRILSYISKETKKMVDKAKSHGLKPSV